MCLPSRHPITFGEFHLLPNSIPFNVNVSLVGAGSAANILSLIARNTSVIIRPIHDLEIRKEKESDEWVSPVAKYLE